ncbi:DNA sulfur modification protein DndD [Clostridium sp. HCS.1]|uniref:DNA sulfur modification protein DndD n=1 Tax=Clostridium sp. HCS.1 TaxID=3238594 RepID=UPI003A101BE3
MIINSITLKNFRSYEDETTFSFSPRGKKNIVLIGGENGAGKSTLFEAIKLCIYGPIIYGYLGQNHNYITRIKNNINDNAYKNKEIESSISLNISFTEGTQIKDYTLTRSWNYINQKLTESFKVFLFDKELNEDELVYFDKFLKSVIPPSLFDFFFFDGEELSDFFTGKSANTSLKESVLQLFNYDTFDILKKQLLTYQRAQSKSNKELEEAQHNFDEANAAVSLLKEQINSLEESISIHKEELDNLLVKKSQTEENFRNSGGIFEEERALLINEINKLDSERGEINQYIKDFCNEILPFIILPDLLHNTKIQIKKEDSLNSFNSIKEKLSGEVVKKSLPITYSSDSKSTDFDEIAVTILNNMFNGEELENVENILQLSNDQKGSIEFTINNILTKQYQFKETLLGKFERLKQISTLTKNLRDRLNSTISGDLLNSYLESINVINKQITEIENNIAVDSSKLEHSLIELNTKNYTLTRAKNAYTTLLQSTNVLEISKNLIVYLEELLKSLTSDKINLIQDEFIDIFSKIIRKENYVNSIVIDDDFNATLYINKEYDCTEILNIIKNLGFDGISKKYGSKFLEDLLKHYNVTTNSELEKIVNDSFSFEYIKLSTKVNINDFSKGEKQIYILCLIWAIIKASGVQIPFIIDTPYARIDETHRNALTTTYLPNISQQVIILSTNKEIDGGLYEVIKPYVCDEYLLLYNTNSRKTEVKNGYFEV